MFNPSSENKGADQLRGYREADLRLCFRLCRLLIFPWGSSLVTDAVKTLVGEENARRGTIKMFEVLQDVRLNKHLFYVSEIVFLQRFLKTSAKIGFASLIIHSINQRTNGPVNAHLSLLHIPINMFEYYGI